ncbi:hypothetical protein GCM10023194_09070 [Planotetraspora phitsanulokensis]|uniref:Uncharacterized protein n=1 Tax=Planotetraspora phitsanulokensis TaxID=575192 RepID=A0A8J3U1Q9_9ACTN|nr:hypothetical protein [Planotetraspora phitsanulokensis]GII35337.1 hypothetical protein Pph01_03400 [Planotetraspora phitsanulokensis]
MADSDVLTFPPVELAPDAELTHAVQAIPLVRDAERLAAWTGVREVTEEGLPTTEDARAAVAELGLAAKRLHLLWVVAVNGRLIEITRAGARPGPGVADPMEFWDGVVMDVLDRTDEGLTGSSVVDEHLTEILATIYSVRDGMPVAALATGILQAHEVGCEARQTELKRLRMTLPGELAEAMRLLEYCGLIEVTGDLVRLTQPGVWAVRRDLLREGHDAPSLHEVAGFAALTAAELVDSMLQGKASASAATLWLEQRMPEDAARELIKIAASGNAAQRGTAGTILEELGPEAEPAVREALGEPMMSRYAAAWLGVRDLDAPALGEGDGAWVAVDTLAALLYITAPVDSMTQYDILGEDLLSLMPAMGRSGHPDALAVLEMLSAHHPDPVIAKVARKTAMKARSRP